MSEYYCPNCGADLENQPGFSPDNGYWTCTECGTLLTDPDDSDFDTDSGATWFCDECGACLNKQYGFDESYGSWTCTECGHVNVTTEDDIYESEDDYHRSKDSGSVLDSINGILGSVNSILEAFVPDEDEEDNEDEEDDKDEDDDEEVDHRENEASHFKKTSSEDIVKCPHCGAVLNDQAGFKNWMVAFTCKKCGTYYEWSDGNKEVETPSSINNSRAYSQPKTAYRESGVFLKTLKRFFITVGVIAVIALVAVVAYYIDAIINGIEVGYENSSVVIVDYEEKEAELKEKGFWFVTAESVADLDYENVNQKNTVSVITVNGKDDFNADDKFSRFSNIKIVYHTVKKVPTPISAKAAKGASCEDVVNSFKEAGFGNIQIDVDYDIILGLFNKAGTVEKISIDGNNKFSEGSNYSVDAEVYILYHEKSSLKPE